MSTRINNSKIRYLLIPFSLLFGLVIRLRHKLFDWKILVSKSFDFPIICVGNITVGGTGKTPHVEYLIETLTDKFKTAVLSRGYKRKTRGYYLASKSTTPEEIGDEPYQIYRKYPNTLVAVCEKRVVGIDKLLEKKKKLQAIILDDAFQHRYVNPGLNILLIDYNRPIYNDLLLPAGNLRDTKTQIKRADIIIITKTPDKFTDIEKRIWIKRLNLFPYQKLFFTTIQYGSLLPLFSNKNKMLSLEELKKENGTILLVTGIANPKPLESKIKDHCINLKTLAFPDHHNFLEADLQKIETEFNTISDLNKLIVTTEKDAVRLKYNKAFPQNLKDKIFAIPIKTEFRYNGAMEFDKMIKDYVAKNKKIGQLH